MKTLKQWLELIIGVKTPKGIYKNPVKHSKYGKVIIIYVIRNFVEKCWERERERSEWVSGYIDCVQCLNSAFQGICLFLSFFLSFTVYDQLNYCQWNIFSLHSCPKFELPRKRTKSYLQRFTSFCYNFDFFLNRAIFFLINVTNNTLLTRPFSATWLIEYKREQHQALEFITGEHLRKAHQTIELGAWTLLSKEKDLIIINSFIYIYIYIKVHLKTHILKPAAIRYLYVGKTEFSESFQFLIRTSLWPVDQYLNYQNNNNPTKISTIS